MSSGSDVSLSLSSSTQRQDGAEVNPKCSEFEQTSSDQFDYWAVLSFLSAHTSIDPLFLLECQFPCSKHEIKSCLPLFSSLRLSTPALMQTNNLHNPSIAPETAKPLLLQCSQSLTNFECQSNTSLPCQRHLRNHRRCRIIQTFHPLPPIVNSPHEVLSGSSPQAPMAAYCGAESRLCWV